MQCALTYFTFAVVNKTTFGKIWETKEKKILNQNTIHMAVRAKEKTSAFCSLQFHSWRMAVRKKKTCRWISNSRSKNECVCVFECTNQSSRAVEERKKTHLIQFNYYFRLYIGAGSCAINGVGLWLAIWKRKDITGFHALFSWHRSVSVDIQRTTNFLLHLVFWDSFFFLSLFIYLRASFDF